MANKTKTSIFIKIGSKLSKFTFSIVARVSFEFINQYDGKRCAIFKTKSGKYVAGTNAPQRNAEPSATTFTIPFIAFLSLTSVLINKAIVKEQNVKTSELSK